MAHFGLLHVRQLGEGTAERWIEEQRIVAEASTTTRRVEDDAFRRTRGDVFASTRIRHSDDAAKPRSAPRGRNIPQSLQRPAATARIVEARATEARRANTGQAAEGVDLDSGIVGEGERPAEARRCPGLQQCIALI